MLASSQFATYSRLFFGKADQLLFLEQEAMLFVVGKLKPNN